MNRRADSNLALARQALVVVGVVALGVVLVLLAWWLAHMLLVLFAAALFAVVLGGFAYPLQHYLSVPRPLAVIVVTTALLGAVMLGLILTGPLVADQVGQLAERLPDALGQLRESLERSPWGQALLAWSSRLPGGETPGTDVLMRMTGAFTTALGSITNAVLVLVIGFYLALNPRPYRAGLLLLVPRTRRKRIDEVARMIVRALRWWLVGRVVAMSTVGVLTSFGLWLVGLPLYVALGLIAGLLSFIPFIGPIVSAVPAVLIGLVDRPLTAVYVIIVFLVVQFLESNLITPLVEERAVSLPPAAVLAAQVLLGVLLGLLGLLLATPLVVVGIVLVQMLYIQDVLGERIEPLGAE